VIWVFEILRSISQYFLKQEHDGDKKTSIGNGGIPIRGRGRFCAGFGECVCRNQEDRLQQGDVRASGRQESQGSRQGYEYLDLERLPLQEDVQDEYRQDGLFCDDVVESGFRAESGFQAVNAEVELLGCCAAFHAAASSSAPSRFPYVAPPFHGAAD
jgi:hypothetical protein